jgi:hypothetical protein
LGLRLAVFGQKNLIALEIKWYIIGRHCCRQPLEILSIIYYDGLTISYLSYITINLNIIPSIIIPTTIKVYKAKDFPLEIFGLGFSGFFGSNFVGKLGLDYRWKFPEIYFEWKTLEN